MVLYLRMEEPEICQGMYNYRNMPSGDVRSTCSFVTCMLQSGCATRTTALRILCCDDTGLLATCAKLLADKDNAVLQQFVQDRVGVLLTRDYAGLGGDWTARGAPAAIMHKLVVAMCDTAYLADSDQPTETDVSKWILTVVKRNVWPFLILLYALMRCGFSDPIICQIPSNGAWCVLDLKKTSDASFADLNALFNFVDGDTSGVCVLLTHWSGWDDHEHVYMIDEKNKLHYLYAGGRGQSMMYNGVCWLIRMCNYKKYDTMTHRARHRYVSEERATLRSKYKKKWTGTWPNMYDRDSLVCVLRACASLMTRDASSNPIQIEVDAAYIPKYVRVCGGRGLHNTVYRYDIIDDGVGGHGVTTDGVVERPATPVMDLPEDTVLMVIRDHVSALISKR